MNLKDYLTECAERAYHFDAWWGWDWIIEDFNVFCRVNYYQQDDAACHTEGAGDTSSWFLLLCGEALSDE